jgi:hypothetical protein
MSSGTENRRTCFSSREGSRDAIVVCPFGEDNGAPGKFGYIHAHICREIEIGYAFIDWHVKVND